MLHPPLMGKSQNYLSGGDSGIRTPDLRIMMKIAPKSDNKINELQELNPTV
jgi:hypothetical protein